MRKRARVEPFMAKEVRWLGMQLRRKAWHFQQFTPFAAYRSASCFRPERASQSAVDGDCNVGGGSLSPHGVSASTSQEQPAVLTFGSTTPVHEPSRAGGLRYPVVDIASLPDLAMSGQPTVPPDGGTDYLGRFSSRSRAHGAGPVCDRGWVDIDAARDPHSSPPQWRMACLKRLWPHSRMLTTGKRWCRSHEVASHPTSRLETATLSTRSISHGSLPPHTPN